MSSPAWNFLKDLSVGTVVAWVALIGTIIAGLCGIGVKLCKAIAQHLKQEDEVSQRKAMLAEHDKMLQEMHKSIIEIKGFMEGQNDVNLKVIRHIIVTACETALTEKYISENKLRALEEMYEGYVNIFHGNGYVTTLMERVRQLVLDQNQQDSD